MAITLLKGVLKKDIPTVELYLDQLQEALNIHRLSSRFIDITFKKWVQEGEAFGDCIGDKKWVTINISKMQSWEDQMKTLAHEMVHAEQFLRGDLTDTFMYKGRDFSECVYENQPWERRAHSLEEKLYNKYYSENN
tara:strand:+ start:1320 stop:1727 length:408 start_codon:yes stop_codon:yes gene_type:complete